MSENNGAYKSLPAVDKLLSSPGMAPWILRFGRELMTWCIRQTLSDARRSIASTPVPPPETLIASAATLAGELTGGHLKRVLNATGIILHTNLGRSPFSRGMLEGAFGILEGYSNLELDLDTGKRGSRNVHARKMLRYITGAEEVLVVNNAAAAVMLILRTFAKDRDVVVSRGELIEIGGSFRIPEIMAASDCRMVEVGTTNKTRIGDYERVMHKDTALLFKAHTSNYTVKGFTGEATLAELAALGKRHRVPVLYDLGSGMIRQPGITALAGEPTAQEALAAGADLVCFSGDKLFGGPQAGIIAGRKRLIEKLSKEPMLRALRVSKTTLALLEQACKWYINPEKLRQENPVFRAVLREKTELHRRAEILCQSIREKGIPCEIIESSGQVGGGSFPETAIASYGVMLTVGKTNKERMSYAGNMYRELLTHPLPLLGVLRQGSLVFDVLTLEDTELEAAAETIIQSHLAVMSKKSQTA
ncbi:MAG: L-seryl-tRNA(Sec) selenium transferase [Bacteroidales bacterium]